MTIEDKGLHGLRVLVTGGSRGLGEETARRFAAAGATVLTSSRTAPPEDLPATFIPADLRSEEGAAELGRRVVDSAGAATAPMPTLKRSDASWLTGTQFRVDGGIIPTV